MTIDATFISAFRNACAEARLAELKSDETGLAHGISVGDIPQGDGRRSFVSLKPLIDEWRTAPERRKGTATVETLNSFIALMKRHADEDSAIFAKLASGTPSLTGVIDYHTTKHEPRFGAHRVAYSFPLSPEWVAWRNHDSKAMSQLDWASFVEERIADLSSPTDAEASEYERLFQTKIAVPSELIQLSRGMQISVEAKVKDIRVLQSGEAEVVYEEVHKDGSGQKLVVPGLFIIQIPLFLDGAPVRLVARLRYRRTEGRIAWFYQLYRPDLAMRDRLQADLNTVAGETGLPVFEGAPES